VSRLKNVGSYSATEATYYGATGVMARCTGLKKDLRINTHSTYNDYHFNNTRSFVSFEGDSYSRFILRMYEMVESTNIINQSLRNFLTSTNDALRFKTKVLETFSKQEDKMEETIKHFKF
jgi:NADH-quinone oxidoreductase subunit D